METAALLLFLYSSDDSHEIMANSFNDDALFLANLSAMYTVFTKYFETNHNLVN